MGNKINGDTSGDPPETVPEAHSEMGEATVAEDLQKRNAASEADSPIEVRVVRRKNRSVLVEWIEDGELRRGLLPPEVVTDGVVASSELAMSIPYGLPWEDIVKAEATPEMIAQELRRRGIWTAEDLRTNGGAAMGAIQAAYGLDLSALRLAAKAYEKQRGR